MARGVAAQLCHVGRIVPANAAVAQRLVPATADAPPEKVAEAATALLAQFVVVVEAPGKQQAAAELLNAATRSRRRVVAEGPLPELPGSLAVALATEMGLPPTPAERQKMLKPLAADETALEAMWQGDDARRPEDQARFYEAALKADPQSALIHNQLGAALGRAGHHDRALHEFDQAITLAPDYAAAHTNRGLVLKQLKRWREAEEAVRKAIQLGAKSPTPYIAMARLLDRVGGTMEAIDELDKAVDLDPSHIEALMTLADYYFESYNLREARKTAERVLALEPDNVSALNLLGLLLLVPHEYEKAEANLRKALELKPDAPETLANLALALYGQKKTKEAIETLERAIALDRGCANAHLFLGRVYYAEARYPEAAEAFQRAAELKPAMIAARQGLADARARAANPSGGCGCLGGLTGGSPRLVGHAPATLLPAVVLLAPHLLRFARRRRR
jgi:tetratricopeptide (TPR) repeat protein